MDFEVQRCTRHCAETGRELNEGEQFYSVLRAEGAEVRRYDYSAEAWHGPPEEGVLGWWKSQMPTREAKRSRMAPRDVLLELFAQLEGQPERQDMLYVLALLLVRHRVLRHEDTETDEAGREVLVLYCPRDETTHRVPATPPSDQRIDEIQDELAQLLYADSGSQ